MRGKNTGIAVTDTVNNVVIRGYVENGSGVPLAEAVVVIPIAGPDPDTVTVAQSGRQPVSSDGNRARHPEVTQQPSPI